MLRTPILLHQKYKEIHLDKIDITLKKCAKCKVEKNICHFGNDKSRKGGLKPYCKDCHNAVNRKIRANDIEKYHMIEKRWRDKNKEKTSQRTKKWALNNKERMNNLIASWRERNPEKYKSIALKHRSKICYKISRTFRNRMVTSIKQGKEDKKVFELLGYTIDELIIHLQKQFVEGMDWDNYGDWHIDHINPISSFDISSYECDEFKVAWGLANLRPLWAKDNHAKHAKILFLI